LSNWLTKQVGILYNLIEAADPVFSAGTPERLAKVVQALPSRVWKVPIDAILAQLANID
jgi:hypothetical protein